MEKDTIEKPIFIMQRKKSFKMTLYFIFITIWHIATAFICIIFTTLDNIIPNIIGFIFLIYTPKFYLDTIGLKSVICYNDYFILEKLLFSKRKKYDDINHEYAMYTGLTAKFMILVSKKMIFSMFWINEYLFKKEDIYRLKKLLEIKNISNPSKI